VLSSQRPNARTEPARGHLVLVETQHRVDDIVHDAGRVSDAFIRVG
jgi:hypothetical protein